MESPSAPEPPVSRLKKILFATTPCLKGGILSAGWLSVLFAGYILAEDWGRALKTPLPHQYGEGVLVWMAREMDESRWPYGDILEVPSRYSCYGPATPALTTLLSRLIGGDELRYVHSGRLLSYSAWFIAALLLAYASARNRLSIAVSSMIFLIAISPHSFFWTLRVDSLVLMFEAAILALLVRGSPSVLKWGLPAAVSALTLTKPPAAADLIPIVIIAIALRGLDWKSAVGLMTRPLLVSVILAPSIFFGLDALTGFRMSDNILWEQMGSGSTSPDGLNRNFRNSLFSSAMWVPLLFATCAIASTQPRGRLMLVSIAISIFLSVTFSTKHGADVNYYFPTMMLICAAAFSYFRLNSLHAPVALLATALLSLPLDPLATHRNPNVDRGQEAYRSDALRRVHDQDNFITEDPFFSVLAGRQPMLTDMFQFTIASSTAGLPTGFMTAKASGAWGGSRLNSMLAKSQPFSPSDGSVPMGVSYVPEAMWNADISKFMPHAPPLKAEWRNLGWDYYRLAFALPLLLLLWACLPFRLFFAGREYPPRSQNIRLDKDLSQPPP
jgi:hypothetical protein